MAAPLNGQFTEVTGNMVARGYDPTKGTHGTKFTPGVYQIDPANKAEGARVVHHGISDPDRAYYTADTVNQDAPGHYAIENSEKAGWIWADNSAGSQHDFIPDGPGLLRGRAVAGRPIVHHVEPIGKMDDDRNLNPRGRVAGEMTADALRITDTEWIRPPSDFETHVQGTLPQENWNKYGDARGSDLNNHGVGDKTQEWRRSLRASRNGSLLPSSQQSDAEPARRDIPGQLELPLRHER